jgi:hypothetical protein
MSKNTDEIGKFGFFPGATVLLSPFAKILSGVLLVALLSSAVFSVVKVFEVKNLKIDLLNEEKETTRLTTELEQCNIALTDQNNAIALLKSDADRDIENMNKINDELNKEVQLQYEEIDRLKARPAPVSCEESEIWLRDNINIFGDNP